MKWLTLLAAASWLTTGAAGNVAAQETVAFDRWLVSSSYPVDPARDPLDEDYLDAPGEIGVLPDRGRTVAGADWMLVREDSTAILDLEAHRGDNDGPTVVYAHAYVRTTSDRTVTLAWGGVACTEVAAWLNGRSLADLGERFADPGGAGEPTRFRARVRLGHGYNTFLLKAISGDCAFGLAASLTAAEPGTLDGLRIQASRPYGSTRTGPSPWLVAAPDAGPEPFLGWKDDELFGAAGVRIAAFAVTAVEGARMKAKTGGEEVGRRLEWLTPAVPTTILMPFEFKTLREALVRGEGLSLELDWKDGKTRSSLSLDPVVFLAALHSSIRLLGWTASGGGGRAAPAPEATIYDAEDQPHPLANLIPLPAAAGTTLIGQWEVPGWLSGFTLRLDVEGAPGEYRLGSVPVDGSQIVLCSDCRKGDRIQLVVTTTDAWERFPGASIDGLPQPVVDDARQAVEWLRLLDEKGNRQYVERAGKVPS